MQLPVNDRTGTAIALTTTCDKDRIELVKI